MREGPILELAVEVALLASRGQPYLVALEQGVSPIFGIDNRRFEYRHPFAGE